MNERYAKCIPFDKNVKGRIGGNPPKCIEEQIPCDYKFYATLVHPEKEDKMLSILIHDNFEILIENNIFPSIAVKVIEHEYSDIGTRSEKSIKELSVNSISNYYYPQDSDFQFIKVGGEPRFIQWKDYYYEELEKEDISYSFIKTIEKEFTKEIVQIKGEREFKLEKQGIEEVKEIAEEFSISRREPGRTFSPEKKRPAASGWKRNTITSVFRSW